MPSEEHHVGMRCRDAVLYPVLARTRICLIADTVICATRFAMPLTFSFPPMILYTDRSAMSCSLNAALSHLLHFTELCIKPLNGQFIKFKAIAVQILRFAEDGRWGKLFALGIVTILVSTILSALAFAAGGKYTEVQKTA
jgi:hypothetical protein